MAAMFTMMNTARLGVGAQGIGLAEAAYQLALAHAKERRQGRAGGTGAIVEHPDVRRMLAEAKAEIFAARATALACGVAIDRATAGGGADWEARAAFPHPYREELRLGDGVPRSPTSASRCMAEWATSRRPGAARFLRDARITPIYEGPTASRRWTSWGGRFADGGEAAGRLVDDSRARRGSRAEGDAADAAQALGGRRGAARDDRLAARGRHGDRSAGASAYLDAVARVLGGQAHLKAALAEGGAGPRRRWRASTSGGCCPNTARFWPRRATAPPRCMR